MVDTRPPGTAEPSLGKTIGSGFAWGVLCAIGTAIGAVGGHLAGTWVYPYPNVRTVSHDSRVCSSGANRRVLSGRVGPNHLPAVDWEGDAFGRRIVSGWVRIRDVLVRAGAGPAAGVWNRLRTLHGEGAALRSHDVSAGEPPAGLDVRRTHLNYRHALVRNRRRNRNGGDGRDPGHAASR